MIIREAAAACTIGEGVRIENALALRKAGCAETVVEYFPPGGGEWKFELSEIPNVDRGTDSVWVRLS